ARKGHGNARLDPGFAGGAALRRPGGKLFGLDRAWDGETRPCRSGNCAPTSLTLRGAQMDLGPPGLLRAGMRCSAAGLRSWGRWGWARRAIGLSRGLGGAARLVWRGFPAEHVPPAL